MKFVRTLMLLICAIGLLSLAGFVLIGSSLAAPVALGGLGSLGLALA
jgi:hypothetical protein